MPKTQKANSNKISSKIALGTDGHRERLRERFSKAGRNAFAEYELLELLLTYTIPRRDTKPIAKSLLHKFGTLLSVLQQPDENLLKIDGIGPKTIQYLNVVHACLTCCMESVIENDISVTGPEDIYAFVRMRLGSKHRECAYALYLNNANHVIHHEQVATGTVDRTSIYPREVLKPALLHNATGMILVHNHPAGQPVPSEDDLEITRLIEGIALPLGIKLMDHMIVTRTQAYSLKTGKLL